MPVAASEPTGRAKWPLEKGALTAVIRERTGVSNRWIADHLAMGHESSVTRAVNRAREGRKGQKTLKSLKDFACARIQGLTSATPFPRGRWGAREAAFWKLAQSFSALVPRRLPRKTLGGRCAGSEEGIGIGGVRIV